MERPSVRAQHLADAYEKVAEANHYMVGVNVDASTSPYSLVDDLEAAEQILINKQNLGRQKGVAFDRLKLALDLVEAAIKKEKIRGR